MISRCGSWPCGRAPPARRASSPRPASRRSRGSRIPSRTPRVPSIGLVSSSDRTRSSVVLELLEVVGHLDPRALDLGSICARREELVQRRVEQADRHRQALHRLEQALEVALLERQQLLEALAPLLGRRGQDHRDHLLVALVAEEHVLGAAQADPLGAELARALARPRACRRWPARPGGANSSAHSRTRVEVSLTSGSTSGTSSVVTVPRRAVDRDQVARARARSRRSGPRAVRGRSRSSRRRSRPARPCRARRAPRGEALPPSLVRTPFAAWKPATSSASVNGRTRMTSRPPRPRPPRRRR